jgi:FkbM family methyltransferase
VNGAQVAAVEAQQGFGPLIAVLAQHNGVTERVHIEIATASGVATSGATVGVAADDLRWASSSHGSPTRPPDASIPRLMSDYRIDRLGLLKVDIEGGEFAVLAADEDLRWLDRVDQVVLEVHRDQGDPAEMADRLPRHGFAIELRDNDGGPVATTSGNLAYAYCRR